MDINRFTEKAQEAVRGSQTLATRYGNQQVEVEHLLYALLDQQSGLVPSILTRAGVNIEPLKESVERDINKMPKVTGPSGPVDRRGARQYPHSSSSSWRSPWLVTSA